MDVKEALKINIDMGDLICSGYLEDLSDEDMMHRPAPESNHIKWQLGHLISSEHGMIEQIAPGSMPPLPEGFAERYTKETAKTDNPAAFDSKKVLMSAFRAQREATLKVLDAFDPNDFDKPTGVDYAPNAASMFSMQGSHYIMHAGQWAVIRRQLGRSPLF